MPIVDKTNKYIDELNESKGLSVKHGDNVLDCLNNILDGTGDLEKRHDGLDSAVYDVLSNTGGHEMSLDTITLRVTNSSTSLSFMVDKTIEEVDGGRITFKQQICSPGTTTDFVVPCQRSITGRLMNCRVLFFTQASNVKLAIQQSRWLAALYTQGTNYVVGSLDYRAPDIVEVTVAATV